MTHRSSSTRGSGAPWASVLLTMAVTLGCAVRSETVGDSSALRDLTGDDVAQRSLEVPGSSHDGEPGDSIGPLQTLASLSRGELWATWNDLRGDPYALDRVERFLEEGDHPDCDPSALVRHGGTHLRYRSPVQVNPAFRERLERFESLVNDVAIEVYGRAPRRLSHFGAYSCRSSRRRSSRLSEHALGNAIDVIGFDFARATRTETLREGLPGRLRASFQVRIARHWLPDPADATAAVHTRFLRELSARLTDRGDVFRVMIGPSRRDHADHFHFDMSPWHYVNF